MKTQLKRTPGSTGQAGFSLVELMVAMLITLIVSGAIYGLMAGGQNAFKVQPELTDRQQNIRTAMDIIMRDVSVAGSGMPAFVQTFTRSLNACTACPDGGAPQGPYTDITDELEILANPDGMSGEPTCAGTGLGGTAVGDTSVNLQRTNWNFGASRPVMIFMADAKTWTPRYVMSAATTMLAGPAGGCAAGTSRYRLGFATGDPAGMNPGADICRPSNPDPGHPLGMGTATSPCTPLSVGFGDVIRYRVRRLDANGAIDNVNGIPVLQRSALSDPSGWQVVATSIEDLQVQYVQANGTVSGCPAWACDPGVPPGGDPNGAPAVTACEDTAASPPCSNAAAYASLITQVRVTLVGRSEAQSIQGMTSAPSGPAKLRGALTSSASPRSALEAAALKVKNAGGGPVLWQ